MNGIRCRRGWNIPVTEATCFRDWNCILLGVLQSSHRTEKIMGKQQDYFSVTMRILQHPPFYEEFKKMEKRNRDMGNRMRAWPMSAGSISGKSAPFFRAAVHKADSAWADQSMSFYRLCSCNGRRCQNRSSRDMRPYRFRQTRRIPSLWWPDG